KVRIWDTHTGVKLKEFKAGSAKVMSMLFYAPDRVATGGSDNMVRLWEASTGTQLQQLAGHTGSISALATDPTGKQLVSGSFDTTVRVWPLATPRPAIKTAQK